MQPDTTSGVSKLEMENSKHNNLTGLFVRILYSFPLGTNAAGVLLANTEVLIIEEKCISLWIKTCWAMLFFMWPMGCNFTNAWDMDGIFPYFKNVHEFPWVAQRLGYGVPSTHLMFWWFTAFHMWSCICGKNSHHMTVVFWHLYTGYRKLYPNDSFFRLLILEV